MIRIKVKAYILPQCLNIIVNQIDLISNMEHGTLRDLQFCRSGKSNEESLMHKRLTSLKLISLRNCLLDDQNVKNIFFSIKPLLI